MQPSAVFLSYSSSEVGVAANALPMSVNCNHANVVQHLRHTLAIPVVVVTSMFANRMLACTNKYRGVTAEFVDRVFRPVPYQVREVSVHSLRREITCHECDVELVLVHDPDISNSSSY